MKKRGQSTVEYALIIAVVLGGLLAMEYYIKRGLEGKMRESADSIGDQFSAENTTYKYTTRQITPQKAIEAQGFSSADMDVIAATGGTKAQGVSYYEVTDAGKTERSATGIGAEVTTSLTTAKEDLF